MPITNTAFENLTRRKDQQVAALLGRGQPVAPQSDPYAEKLRSHDLAIDRARARAETVLPERGVRPPEPARSWGNDYQVRVGEFVMPASVLLVGLLQNDQGPALVAEIAESTPGLSEAILSYLNS